MALAASTAALLAVVLFAFVATAFGHRLLRLCSLEVPDSAEHLLCSTALGVICLEIFLFLSQLCGNIRAGIIVVVAAVVLLAATDFAAVSRRVSQLLSSVLSESKLEKTLASLIGLVLLIQGFAAMAPLTGSDALHYHFTAPSLTLQTGFHPNFFLSHSFFSAQSHLLILMGLALGSSQLAMGLMFLGGLLAAAACACLMRRWANGPWKWTAALVFLVTPVVFWQSSGAGAPDLWMAFFATVGVLVISRANELPRAAHAVLAGVLAGGVAGTKYTGCAIAASMAVAFFWEARSAIQRLLFLCGSLGAGIWPYARNFFWTGDPVFPFLTRWLTPGKVNAYTLASYIADTGSSESRHALQVLKFPVFAAIDRVHLGFWQFLGPLALAFIPLLLLVVRNTPLWRAALTVWVLGAIAIGATSGMTRFLLPVLPIAIAAALAGVAQLEPEGWRFARSVSLGTVGCFLLLGASGLLIYNRSAISAAVGLTPREEYLRRHAPEYEKVQFINEVLAGKESEGKTLVFLRHVFYLRVPFLYGDPAASWAVDPSKFQTPDQWKALFKSEGVRRIVRSPQYPPTVAAPLQSLEDSGDLVPVAQKEVSDFHGFRILEDRRVLPVVILRVK
jgi:Protein of unknown function (DUF1420)